MIQIVVGESYHLPGEFGRLSRKQIGNWSVWRCVLLLRRCESEDLRLESEEVEWKYHRRLFQEVSTWPNILHLSPSQTAE
jgi:hypothetical protein